MVTQKMISFKVNVDQLETFDDTCRLLGVKRNKLLNFLVYYANVNLSDPNKLALLISYSNVVRNSGL